MRKIIMVIVCLMTMMFSSCSNIEEDTKKAFDKFDVYGEQCINAHVNKDVEKTLYEYKLYVKNQTKEFNIDFKTNAERLKIDSENLLKECFEDLFKKYGEKKTLQYAENYIGKYVYNFKSKEDFYDSMYALILGSYTKEFKDKIKMELNI